MTEDEPLITFGQVCDWLWGFFEALGIIVAVALWLALVQPHVGF